MPGFHARQTAARIARRKGPKPAPELTDAELIEFLGIKGKVGCAEIVANLTPQKRAVYERMHQVETELHLWQQGVGRKPEGVIVCGPRQVRRR